jgi:signal transduction histidine kinase
VTAYDPRPTRVSGERGKGVRLFGTATDIDDLKRTEGMLRQLSTQLMKSQDDERRRIAREIHDTTVATIVAAKWQVEQVREGIPADAPSATALGNANDLLGQSLS